MDDSRPTPHGRPEPVGAPTPGGSPPQTNSTARSGATADSGATTDSGAATDSGATADSGQGSRWPGRRSVLAGGAAVVLAAAAGTAAGLLPDHDHDVAPSVPRPAPRALSAAAARERALIADLDATTGGSPAVRIVLVRARADHAAHLAAFEHLLADYDPPAVPTEHAPTSAATATPVVHGTARTAAALAAAEHRAATASARAAAISSGRLAVLLASVSASESSHAELIA